MRFRRSSNEPALHFAHHVAAVVEQVLFKGVDLLVEILHGLEVPVDHEVEHAIEKESGAFLDQLRSVIPSLDDLVDVEVALLAHRDERVRRHEHRDLTAA